MLRNVTASRPRPLLALTLPELWAFLAIALPTVAALIAPLSTVDLAYNIRAGQLMLEQGTIMRTDPFTFTVGGQPWLDQQWAAQVVLGVLHDVGGWALLAASERCGGAHSQLSIAPAVRPARGSERRPDSHWPRSASPRWRSGCGPSCSGCCSSR
jgi:hypothetical protein